MAGLVVTWVAFMRRRDDDPAGRDDLWSAVVWQALGAAVVAMHVLLQLAIVFVDHLFRVGPGLGEPLQSLFPLAILGITWLNVGGGVAEWLFLAVWAVLASRGRPYPFGPGRSRAHDQTSTG